MEESSKERFERAKTDLGATKVTGAPLPPYLYAKWCRGAMDLSGFLPLIPDPEDAIDRVTGLDLTAEKFRDSYESKSIPVMIEGKGLVDSWKAMKTWTVDELIDKYCSTHFKVGNEYGRPRRVDMSFSSYVEYMRIQNDEAPLYVFDGGFGEKAPEMLTDYSVSHIFEEDILSLLPERPSFRWLVIGPARSGASWHVDPLGTSAWNTLLSGRKRWALYPPDALPPGVTVTQTASGGRDFKSPAMLYWYLEVYPNLPPDQKPIEIVQEPGETIFVPAGWWHAVLNIGEVNVAVTQNWAGRWNLSGVVRDLFAVGKVEAIEKLKTALEASHSSLLRIFMDAYALHGPSKDPLILAEGCSSRAEFLDSFTDSDVWVPRVRDVVRRVYGDDEARGVVEATISPLGGGVNAVFLSTPSSWSQMEDGSLHRDDSDVLTNCPRVIKFFSHLQGAGLASWASEISALARTASVADHRHVTPKLISSGHLRSNDGEHMWSWPYIVMTQVASTTGDEDEPIPVGAALPSLTQTDLTHLAEWLARELYRIHHLPPLSDAPPHARTQAHFATHAKNRIACARECVQTIEGVPARLVDELSTYLEGCTWTTKEDGQERATFLHGDVTSGNVLGVEKDGDGIDGGQWTPIGMIDFGDSYHYVGSDPTNAGLLDPWYDIACMHVSIFKCSIPLLRRFVKAYFGNMVTYSPEWWAVRRRRMMGYVLSWEFEGVRFGWTEKGRTAWESGGNWHDVEEMVFGNWE
ncbi:hypothetical protein HK104_006629 [Borealophlyctis nickersoniae]|nr:hypothetical protein HK104_006629 [Borealophlyctis nickersoniae]